MLNNHFWTNLLQFPNYNFNNFININFLKKKKKKSVENYYYY